MLANLEMSLARGKFGIEYDPRKLEPEPSGFGWIIVLVAFAAFISLSWALVKRVRSGSEPIPEPVEEVAVQPVSPAATAQVFKASSEAILRRPTKLRNLLLRLDEAEKAHDVEMAVTTIESIRALPGSPAADIDDSLARRLGALNLRRLFELRSAQWVKTVTVGRGDSASRIAAENGSTLASLARLNGGNVETIRLGAKLHVMDHPRFNLVLHKRTRIADLSLNGKFFKRYDLQGDVRAREGAYEVPVNRRNLWSGWGSVFGKEDRAELDMLLPKGAPILISNL